MTFNTKKSAIALISVAIVAASIIPANAATKAATKPTPKPAITAAPGGGPNSAAFAKYTACLAKAGIKFPGFGGGRGFGAPGTRPTGAPAGGGTAGSAPRPRPTFSMTPAQQKAFAACAALRPSFGGFDRNGGGVTPDGRGGGIAPGGVAPGTTKVGGGATAPKTGTSAAYIACLNTHGIPVQSAAQIAGLDSQNSKVLAAEKACAGK